MHSSKLNQSLVRIISRNGSTMYDDSDEDYLYDRSDVRAVSIILYSIVFIACFFGNLIVIVVVTVHWRMRSITNFCLANLAFADFCVSIFCVYQNMYIYFMSSWVFGAFLCKMYYFITELSHTASILILVVICIERYLAIVHPMRCKEWLTLTRLRVTIIGVWGTSAIYSSPRIYFTNIGTMSMFGGEQEVLCIPIRTLYDSETFDMINLAVLFVLPLLVISILYTRIALALWESSKNQIIQTPHHYSPSASAGRQESLSSSNEHDCGDGSHVRSGAKGMHHSCADILCCGCDPCRIRFLKRQRQSRSLHHYKRAGSNGSLLQQQRNGGRSSPFEQQRRNTAENRQIRTTPINSVDPIVVFKFEENGSRLGGKRGRNQSLGRTRKGQQCTILFNRCSPESRTDMTADYESANIGEEGVIPLNELLSERARRNQLASTMPLAKGTGPNKLIRMTVTRGGKFGIRALAARRRIIKMLVVIVFAFAVCNLPFHARKIWQNYGSGYSGGSTFSSIFTPVTFLIMYANSGINPILYAFMSKKFRICFMDLLNCKLKRSLRVARNASVRSTHIIKTPV